MDELQLFEKLLGGTVGGVVVLGVTCWFLWNRLIAREDAHAAQLAKKDEMFTAAIDGLRRAIDGLKDAIEERGHK